MQEAAILQMYFEKLPEIAEAVAMPLANIDKITMYGEGNTTKLVSDITNSTNQISEGLLGSLGISLKDLVGGLVTGKAIGAGITDATNATTKPNEKRGKATVFVETSDGSVVENMTETMSEK